MPNFVLAPLVVTAGLLALVLLWPRVRSGPAGVRLAAEAVVTTLALRRAAVGPDGGRAALALVIQDAA